MENSFHSSSSTGFGKTKLFLISQQLGSRQFGNCQYCIRTRYTALYGKHIYLCRFLIVGTTECFYFSESIPTTKHFAINNVLIQGANPVYCHLSPGDTTDHVSPTCTFPSPPCPSHTTPCWYWSTVTSSAFYPPSLLHPHKGIAAVSLDLVLWPHFICLTIV